jgi:hypothetical protein
VLSQYVVEKEKIRKESPLIKSSVKMLIYRMCLIFSLKVLEFSLFSLLAQALNAMTHLTISLASSVLVDI